MSSGIVAYAYGVPSTIKSNRQIAEIAARKAQQLGGVKIYTQADIQFDDPLTRAVYTTESVGNPPPTLRIARRAVYWARGERITELWVVAAKPHLWRAMRDTEKAVQESGADIKVLACEEISHYSDDSWFCVDSTQSRTQTREAWEGRERVLRVMPFFVYKHVAS